MIFHLGNRIEIENKVFIIHFLILNSIAIYCFNCFNFNPFTNVY
jgi:hypothetical protein